MNANKSSTQRVYTNKNNAYKSVYRKSYGKVSNMISQRQFNTNRDSQLVCLDMNNQYVSVFTGNDLNDKFFIFLASSENYVSKIVKAQIQANQAYYYAYFDISPQVAAKFKLPSSNLLGSGNGYYNQLRDYITKKPIAGAYMCNQSTLTDEIRALLQQQSNGQLVNMASNNLVYSKTLQLYKPKAYDYLQDVIQNYVEGEQNLDNEGNSTIVRYYQNDKMLVILPTTNFATANSVVNNQQWNIQLKRTYYIRKQDITVGNTISVDVETDTLPDQNAINTQGNENAADDQLSRGYLLQTAAEVNDIISNNNGIVIDSNCYDANEGALSATAIVDLQPAPQDTELINHENETAASNAFVEVAGQAVSGVQDINKVNIGPNWVEIPDSGVAQCVCAADIVRSYTYTSTSNMGKMLNEPTYDIASLYINCQVGTPFTYGDSATALVQLTLTQSGNDYTMAVSTLAGTLTFYQKEQIISYLNHQNISVYPYLPIAYYFPLVITQIETAYVVAVEASKVWKKIKTGLHKAAKWIGGKVKGLFKIAPKVIKGVSGLLPGPIGTVANIVGEGIESITSVINAKSVATSANNVLSVSDYSTEEDVFVCTPQYRITDQPTADITQGTDWIDGEAFNVPVLESGSLTQHMYKCTHQVSEHPLIKQIVSGRLTGASGVAVQQRLKIKFLKHCTRAVANAYKAGLLVGSDTYAQ